MAHYEGMRWFKCDFQVQTPEDGAHWGDDDTRLPEPRSNLCSPQNQMPMGLSPPQGPDEHTSRKSRGADLDVVAMQWGWS